jgi:hypothetical protein
MSAILTEQLRSSDFSEANRLELAKKAFRHIIAPNAHIEIETLDAIPLKAVTDLSHIHDPFEQLSAAARLHEVLPTKDVTATIDPLIDSSSHDLVAQLAEEDRRRRLPSNDPDHIHAKDDGMFLLPREVEATFMVHDAHPSPQTKMLAEFAVEHAASTDLKATFRDAKRIAEEKDIPLMDALSNVQSSPAPYEPNAIREGYDWLYADKT